MYKHLVVAFGLMSGLVGIHAQPPSSTWRQDGAMAGGRSAEQAPTQRQAELRSALRAQRYGGAEANNNTRGGYQLSSQERSELRQQLRQQRREGIRQ